MSLFILKPASPAESTNALNKGFLFLDWFTGSIPLPPRYSFSPSDHVSIFLK